MVIAIAVHGGAGRWNVPEDIKKKAMDVLREAVDVGYDVLARGGSAIDAVVEAITVLEDSGIFNAGTGSVLNVLGFIEMDAGLCTSDGRVGAVCCVKYPKNPIRLARIVMEMTDHVLVCGEGADRLARAVGLEPHPGPTDFIKRRFEELKSHINAIPYWKKLRNVLPLLERGDTVGAVAIDNNGLLAAAASTGGVWLKLPGRVGDSPIYGAGFYASTNCAACATGLGETIVKSMACSNIVKLVDSGIELEEACRLVISKHSEIFGKGTIGILAMDRSGKAIAMHNTELMPYAWKQGEKLVVSLHGVKI